MNARTLAVLTCIVVVLPVSAADALTSSELYRACQAPKKSPSHTFCRTYISGYFDGFAQAHAHAGVRPKRFCPGYGLTVEQIVKKVEPFLKPYRGQPEDEVAEMMLAVALLSAYKCEEAKEQPK
jgi:hypothetical protein